MRTKVMNRAPHGLMYGRLGVPLPQQPPPLGEDGPVQLRLLTHVPARLLGGSPGRGGHVLDVELLESDQVIGPGEHRAGLLAGPYEVGAACVFLASDLAGYVTGSTLATPGTAVTGH